MTPKNYITHNVTQKDLILEQHALVVFDTLVSISSVRKAIKKGNLLVNDLKRPSNTRLDIGDVISLKIEQPPKPKPFITPITIVYQDAYMAVVIKPAGMVVSGNQFKTLENALRSHIEVSKESDALPWAKPVHRLDSATSGLVIVAKTYKARVVLGEMLEKKKIKKTYHAIVTNTIARQGEIHIPINGKTSISGYKNIQTINSLRNKALSLVRLSPITGRTHQLRIHMACIGAPIAGDVLYGVEGHILKHKGLFLCATAIELAHPITRENMHIAIDIPEKFRKYLARESKSWNKYNS